MFIIILYKIKFWELFTWFVVNQKFIYLFSVFLYKFDSLNKYDKQRCTFFYTQSANAKDFPLYNYLKNSASIIMFRISIWVISKIGQVSNLYEISNIFPIFCF